MKKLFQATIVAISVTLAFAIPANAEEKSLYDRIGGYKAVALAVDHLVDKLYVNKTLNQNPAIKQVHDLE